MPIISRFFGIVIFINYRDHNPPHFHARYQGQEVTVEIETGLVTGTMSRRALQLVFEWLDLHRDAVMENWNRARQQKPLVTVDPLP
jgi:hypothetical protein